jgi:hypothetical protein
VNAFNPLKHRVKSHLLELLGGHHILHVGRIRVNGTINLKGVKEFKP